MKFLKILAVGLVLLIAGLFGLAYWMANGSQSPRSFGVLPQRIDGIPLATNTTTVTVMTYNMGWAYGAGSESEGKKSKEAMQAGLTGLVDALKKTQPDIVLIQEIDFDAGRSHGVDQAKAIAKAAGYAFYSPAVSWDINYLPFPYWPPSGHWGHINSGGAILSRHPILRCKVELLEKPLSQPFWYRPFYLFRYLQRCDVLIDETPVSVFNTHLEAFDLENRLKNARRVAEVLKAEGTENTIFGGDLNAPPPEAKKKSGFANPEDEYTGDTTLEVFRKLDILTDVVPVEAYRKDEAKWFTFPAHAPDRKLDYLFVGKGLQSFDTQVPPVGDPSDHLPLMTRVRFVYE